MEGRCRVETCREVVATGQGRSVAQEEGGSAVSYLAGRVVRVYELMHVTCCRVGSTQLSAVTLWLA